MIVTGTVTKESKDSKVGIAFTQSKRTPLIIKKITEDGLFASSKLKEGMFVLQVNGQDVHGKSAEDSINMLREAEGECTVTAVSGVGASMVKESKESKVGITFGQKPSKKDDVLITSIKEDGLFGKSKLKVGQKVLIVNGKECPKDVKEAITLLREASGRVSIVVDGTVQEVVSKKAAPEQAPRPPKKPVVSKSGQVITGKVHKDSMDTKVGISFTQSPSLPLSIASVTPGGLFEATGLEEGMFVLEVNGQNVDGKLSEDVIRLLRDEDGEVSVKAIRATGASVLKPERGAKTGISFKKGKDAVIIAQANGLFKNTRLKRGQKLFSVNGVTIDDDDVVLVASMIRGAMGKVSLLAVNRTEEEMKADDKVAAAETAAAKAARAAKVYDSLPEGAVVTGTIEKESADDQVGIALTQTDSSPLCISAIVPGCLFSETDLKPGMWVLSINGENVHGKSAGDAIKPIREGVGEISVTAIEGTAASVNKPERGTKVGISLKAADGVVVVHKTQGLFTNSNLHVGERVYAINGEIIGDNLISAIRIIRNAVGKVSVITGPHVKAPKIAAPLAAAADIAVGKEKVRNTLTGSFESYSL
jgi:C-terminal processing protease CtpA/Prc